MHMSIVLMKKIIKEMTLTIFSIFFLIVEVYGINIY